MSAVAHSRYSMSTLSVSSVIHCSRFTHYFVMATYNVNFQMNVKNEIRYGLAIVSYAKYTEVHLGEDSPIIIKMMKKQRVKV